MIRGGCGWVGSPPGSGGRFGGAPPGTRGSGRYLGNSRGGGAGAGGEAPSGFGVSGWLWSDRSAAWRALFVRVRRRGVRFVGASSALPLLGGLVDSGLTGTPDFVRTLRLRPAG
jgi:hypothetical protein